MISSVNFYLGYGDGENNFCRMVLTHDHAWLGFYFGYGDCEHILMTMKVLFFIQGMMIPLCLNCQLIFKRKLGIYCCSCLSQFCTLTFIKGMMTPISFKCHLILIGNMDFTVVLAWIYFVLFTQVMVTWKIWIVFYCDVDNFCELVWHHSFFK